VHIRALIGAFRALGHEVREVSLVARTAQAAGAGLQLVSLAPGVIDTPMQETVRGASTEDFADVARFRQMKAAGELRDPEAARA